MESSKNTIKHLSLKLQEKEQEIAKLKEQLVDNKKRQDSTFNYFEDIIAKVPGCVYWLDKNNTYLGCNNNLIQLLGLSSTKDIIGKTNYDLPWKDDAPYLDDFNNKVMKSGKSFKSEEIVQIGKEKRIFVSEKVPIYDLNKKIIGVVGISIDITESKKLEHDLKKAKEKAEAANLAKDQFIRNMSHDIRTPLSGIIGMSSILEEEAHSAEEKEHAHMVNVSGEQLLTLLNSVLDIIASGSQKENEINLSTFNIFDLIHNIADLELPTIKLKNLDLKIHLDNELPKTIISDQIKIHRILLNILGNSVKFTEKGYIEIGARKAQNQKNLDKIEFYIKDTGVGIKPEEQKQIFKKFYRGTSSYQGIYSGHGVGLHIVKKYIHLLHGDISVKSELGHGTTFTVTIPVQIEKENYLHNSTPLLPSINTDIVPPLIPINILLVEDNPIALKMAENVLIKMKIAFISAINGKQAIALFKNNNFDLVITDIGLPDITGNQVARIIRSFEQESNKRSVPIVGLTAHSINEAENDSLLSGMNLLLSKPMRQNMIQDLLNRYKLYDKPSSLIATEISPSQSSQNINALSLLDIEAGLKSSGSKEVLKDLLKLLIIETQKDLEIIQLAWKMKDYNQVQSIAHRMKSGAVYCGTVRMKQACEDLEHHFKFSKSGNPTEIYDQFCLVNQQTIEAIEHWLKKL